MSKERTESIRLAAAAAGKEIPGLADRIAAELDFAEGLIALHPAKEKAWRRLIAKASETVSAALAAPALSRRTLPKAVAEAEAALAPIGREAKKHTVHLVGHAHIDMNWMWPWPETVAVTRDTFTTVLALMEEFPEFRFTQSQASVYEIARKYCPDLFERIRRRVREGRWEVAAVHWVEGDKNLAAGESLARHMLYTRAYMGEQLGLSPEDAPLDWEPDTFGHAATVPMIVSAGGAKFYYLCRGGETPLPPVFWWKGPDGSRVLAMDETTWYLNEIGTRTATDALAFCARTGLKDWMCVFGVGDHGGGPTRRDLRRAVDMNGWPIYPRFRFAFAREYYELLEREGGRWPQHEGELNYEFTGCYTSQSAIKKANRHCENALLSAESAAVAGWRAAGVSYPAAAFREAWVNTLFGQFHDILPGSGVRATREYQSGLAQEVHAITGTAATAALRALADRIDTSAVSGRRTGVSSARPAQGACPPSLADAAFGAGAGRASAGGGVSDAAYVSSPPVSAVVFNPCAWERTDVVKVTLWDVGEAASFRVRRPGGGPAIAAQKIGAGTYWGHQYVDLAVPVRVGGLGYQAVVIEAGEADAGEPGVKCNEAYYGHWGERIRTRRPTMENEFLLAEIDPATGGLSRLVDKASGAELAMAADPLAVLEYLVERPRGMSSWVLADPVRPPGRLEVVSMSVEQQGPHLASLAVRLRLDDSTVTVVYTLKAGAKELEIHVRATWLERGSEQIGTPCLRMRFPMALREAAGRYEIPFGSIERPPREGQEVPALRWADVSGLDARGQAAGCTLLNDGKHGHSLEGSTLRLTLIRSSYSPDPLPEMGEHEIRLALAPRGGAAAVADLHRAGTQFNQPMLVATTGVHEGELPPAAAGVVSCEPASVVVCGVKKAEEADAVVFRLLETAGEEARAAVALDEQFLGAVVSAVETDLLEREKPRGSAEGAGSGFRVRLAPRGIASVKVSLRGNV